MITGLELLKNKTAIITGGAQGLGLSTASYLAQNGANVAIFDLDGDGAVGTRHHTVVPDIENYDDED